MIGVGVGVDFGTSNSAAAWFDGEKVRLVKLDPAAVLMPTATHLDRNLAVATGQPAVDQYIDENQDRIVELTAEVIAKSDFLIEAGDSRLPTPGQEVSSQDTYGAAHIDRGLPGRLFRGVKRLLGNPAIQRLMVFEQAFRLVALITPILVHIRERLQQDLLDQHLSAHFGHPVEFEGQGQNRNNLGLERLREACGHAGFNEVEFYPEPIAATLSYLHLTYPEFLKNSSMKTVGSPAADGNGAAAERNNAATEGNNAAPETNRPVAKSGVSVAESGNVLTFDFGGGTLDLSIVTFQGARFDVLATAGLALGGDHIDQLIFRQLLFPLLGQGEIWSRVKDGQLIENQFPFSEYEDKLLNWAVTYTLNQNRYRSKISDCINQGGPAAEKFQRLDELITHNYSYLVFQAIKSAKVELSEQAETLLDIPELDIAIKFTRSAFEAMMQPMFAEIDQLLALVFTRSGLTGNDIDIVIRTGGSSQITALKRLLEMKFPGKVTEHDPFTSVAAGLAIANYYNLRC